MAIKKLQNNFTTQEQSKRLLELGVPADSADMGYQALNGKCYSNDMCGWRVSPSVLFIAKPDWSKHEWYPCWSVGRLIEIITICREEIYTRLLFSRVDDHTNIENLIHYISAEIGNGHIDFSKLEE